MALGTREFVFKYSGDATSLEQASLEAQRALNSTATAGDRLQEMLNGLGRGAAGLLVGGGLAAGAMSAGRALFDASAGAERLRITLGSVSAVNSADELERLRDLANRMGVDFRSTAEAFVSFAAAARGTSLEGAQTRQIFESVARSAKALGANGEQVTGSLLALQQMLSKGTVSAEELRGQLGERMPGAFQVAARAMGVTTAELGKMLEQGQIAAVDFLPKFARQLEVELGGAADRAASSLESSAKRMGNAWDDLKTTLGDTGFARATANGMEGIAGVLERISRSIKDIRAAGGGGLAQVAGAANQAGIEALSGLARNVPIAGPLLAGAVAAQRGLTQPDGQAAATKAREDEMARLMAPYGTRSGAFKAYEERQDAIRAARDKFLAQFRTDSEKEADEIRAYVSQFAGKVDEQTIRRDVAAIRAKFAGSGKKVGEGKQAPRETDRAMEELGKLIDQSSTVRFERNQQVLEQLRRLADSGLDPQLAQEIENRLFPRADGSTFGPQMLPEMADAWRDLSAALRETPTRKAAELRAELQALYELQESGGIQNAQEYTDAVSALNARLRDLEPVAAQTATALSSFADQASRNIQDALGDTLVSTLRGNFRDIGSRWTELLQRLVAQAAAVRLNEALFGPLAPNGQRSGGLFDLAIKGIAAWAGGGSGASWGSEGRMMPSASAGGRAGGGPVTAGNLYMVGERGPELFAPAVPGRVIANPDMQRMGSQRSQPLKLGDVNIRIDSRTDAAQVQQMVAQGVAEGHRMTLEQLRLEGVR